MAAALARVPGPRRPERVPGPVAGSPVCYPAGGDAMDRSMRIWVNEIRVDLG
ncbi:MAG TPA: hypothetical protein VKV80_06530 [Streptosporangiaceae bacterium]|nr:hypothetical protein [Streptosporangiaceae bacterium]